VAEEQGLEGAALHARRAVEEGWNIEAIFNNDIIGNSHGGGGAYDSSSLRIFSEESADSGSRQLARYIRDMAVSFVPSHEVRLIAREDRFGRGGDHTPYNRQGFTAVRITESKENYSRQHTAADTLDGVDFQYLAQNARVNLASMFSLAAAPAAPLVQGERGPMLTRGDGYDAVLSWQTVQSAVAYRLVWRDGWELDWSHSKVIAAEPSTPTQSHTLLSMSIDDYIFGVSAIGEGGFESLVSPYVRPSRADPTPPIVEEQHADDEDPVRDSATGDIATAGAPGDSGNSSFAGVLFAMLLGLAVGGMVGFGIRRKGWGQSGYAGLGTKDVEDGHGSD